MFNYPIDWGATGTWGLIAVGLGGLLFAWRQIESSRELRKNEITLTFISRFTNMETQGVFATARDSLKGMDFSNTSYDIEVNKNISKSIIYFLELGYYYRKGLINKELLKGVFPVRFVAIYQDFIPFIEWQRKAAPYTYLTWEAMIKDMRKVAERIRNQKIKLSEKDIDSETSSE